MPANGLDKICANLITQDNKDKAGWGSLIEKTSSGIILRVLSPNTGRARNSSLFQEYFDAYVHQVWAKYTGPSTTLTVDTQASWGRVTGHCDAHTGTLSFGQDLTFTKPSTADIFSCSTGSFTPSSNIEKGALIARITAGFNRSTLLEDVVTPSSSHKNYYGGAVTNHYARIVHAANADGKGYAFPFDDVTPAGGVDQSGAVQDGIPKSLTVTVGGRGVGG